MAEKTDVLVVGSGGRESAVIWKLLQSPRIGKLYATGNGGMYPEVERINIPQTDFQALAQFAKEKEIGLTVVAMDNLLADGVVDCFQEQGLKIFGPAKAAAKIEASKAWAKELMHKAGIPTAMFVNFKEHDSALDFALTRLRQYGAVVIKADGLALGKGVEICRTQKEVEDALNRIMVERVHGASGDVVVVEEFLEGPEVSFHVLVDTKGNYELFPITQDHKREGDGDTGRNTGGMGVVGPVPIITKEQIRLVEERVVQPLLDAMEGEGSSFAGCLYPGMILTSDGPKVLEFNCRLGDPETQVYMMLLDSDLLDLLEACVDGTLDQIEIKWKDAHATCVAMASEGYPGDVTKKGMSITGVEVAEDVNDVVVFYAGATQKESEEIVNSGGRVLYVVATRTTLKESIDAAYEGIEKIHFEGGWHRNNIGAKCLPNKERG